MGEVLWNMASKLRKTKFHNRKKESNISTDVIERWEEIFFKVEKDTYIGKDIARSFDSDSIIDVFSDMKEHHNSRCLTIVDKLN